MTCLSGRKLSLSEQLTALIMLELPFYGLFPSAVPFIFYIGKISSTIFQAVWFFTSFFPIPFTITSCSKRVNVKVNLYIIGHFRSRKNERLFVLKSGIYMTVTVYSWFPGAPLTYFNDGGSNRGSYFIPKKSQLQNYFVYPKSPYFF